MIKALNLTKKFTGKTVVENINLEIGKGEIVGLLGPNGAGKTTTIRMIAGTLHPSSGQVFIDDQDLSNHEENKSLIGYLPENNPLYENLTVEEHLNFWINLKKVTSDKEKLIKVIVAKLALDEVYYRPISELSKGFKQRVGLAQALLSNPPILLLDEPTEGLDPNQRREIAELILGLGLDRTVIICSHVLSEITKMCRRVVIINQGKIVADDSLSNLTNRSNERQIINVVLSGSGVKKGLEEIVGVISVKEETPSHFHVEARNNVDLREIIFEMAKNKNWKLLELSAERKSLDDVFTALTKSL